MESRPRTLNREEEAGKPAQGRENLPFDPSEELDAIWRAPSAERKQHYKDFKEKLLQLEEAWSRCRIEIENRILKNPDVSKEELLQVIESFGQKHGFTPDQKEEAEGNINAYLAERKKVLDTRARFPNDLDLVEELTDMRFGRLTPLRITTGPMSIDIVTDPRTADKIYEGRHDDVQWLPYAAFAAESASGVNFSVFKMVIGTDKATEVHELEHQKNKIFRELFDREFEEEERVRLFAQYHEAISEEEKVFIAERTLKKYREHAFDRAKDEILAVASDTGRSVSEFLALLKDRDAEVNSYDYLRFERSLKHEDALWQEVMERVLVKEYDKSVEKSVKAYESLERFYTRRELAGLLADKPFEDWPKFAARVYKDRLQDESVTSGDVLNLQKKREVKERLTRRALLFGGAALAGYGALKIPETQREIHESGENIESVETEHARYSIAYSSGLLPESTELARADAVIAELEYGEDPRTWFSAQEYGDPEWAYRNGDRLLAQTMGLDPDRLPARFQRLLQAMGSEGKSIYLVDTYRAKLHEMALDKDIGITISAGVGLLIGDQGRKLLTKRGTKRDFLKGLGKMAFGGVLALPLLDRFAKVSALERRAGSMIDRFVKANDSLNQVAAAEFIDQTINMRNAILAQNSEQIAETLSRELGHKPSLALITGTENFGIERVLRMSRNERLAMLAGTVEVSATAPQVTEFRP